jgi:hypothetical protein
MSVLRMGNDPARLAEVVTTSSRLLFFRSSAGLTFKFSSFLQPSPRRSTHGSMKREEKASRKKAVTVPSSALVLSGIPGTGRFLF